MTTTAPPDEPPTDVRFLRAFWKLVRWALPVQFRYFGTYEFRIAKAYPGGSAATTALDLQATEDTVAVGLTDVPKVQPWSGLAGAASAATTGSRVLVQFINGNGARPIVVSWAPNGDSGWLPASMTIDSVGAIGIGPSGTVNLAAAVNRVLVENVLYNIGSSVGAITPADPMDPLLPRVKA